jgi:hypothetical protein
MRARQRHLNPRFAGATVVFDARYITGLSDGSNVGSWNDRSGNANNATTVSNYPTYETDGQGGNPVVRFVSASSTRLTCTNSSYSGTGARFVIVAYKCTSTGTYSNAAAGQSGAATTGTWFVVQSRTQSVTGDPYIAGYSADTQNNKSTPDNSWKVATGAYNGTTIYTRKSGIEIDAVNRTLNTNNSAFRIGHDIANSTLQEFFGGDIAYIAAGPAAYSVPLLRRIEHAMGLSYKIACS